MTGSAADVGGMASAPAVCAGPAGAGRPRLLRRQPDRGRGRRSHRGRLEPGRVPATSSSSRRNPTAVPGFVDVLAGRLGERRRLRVCGPLDDDGGRRLGAGSRIGDRIPGMRAGVRTGPARRPADTADRAGRAQQGSRPAHRRGAAGRAPRGSWSAWAAAPAPTAAADWSTSSAAWHAGRRRLAGSS